MALYAHNILACSLVSFSNFEQIEKNVYVAPTIIALDRKQLLSLIAEAKFRVATKYGQLESTPVIIAAKDMESLRSFSSNEYASTHFLPGQAYVVLGPKGQNTDVISHELVHAGIFEQVGYWKRTVDIPVWFDEGAAMQVDYREKYDLPTENVNIVSLNDLRYGWQFFRGNDAELTTHYAVSKAELKRLLFNAGKGSIQSLLQQVKSGMDFNETYQRAFENTKANNAFNIDSQKQRFAPLLLAG